MKRFVALLSVLAAMLTLCACESAGSSSSKSKNPENYGLYIKDSDFFFTDFKGSPWQLSTRLVDDEEIEEEDIAEIGDLLGLFTYVNEDGSLIFFPDKISTSDAGFNLYYRKTNEPTADAVKIDSEVTHYVVNSSSTLVTYLKDAGEDSYLYQYSINDDTKRKLASEVSHFDVVEDGSKIYFVDTEGNLYLFSDIEHKERITGDITEVVSVSEDFTTFYYIKDESLYKHTVGGDRVKIDSGIHRIIKLYETGEIYYLKKNTEPPTMMDFFVDDMKETDNAAPTVSPAKPTKWNYSSTDAYNEAYENYEKEYEAYSGKKLRDEWRTLLSAPDTSFDSIYTFCYYSGTEVTTITENFSTDSYCVATDNPVITYLEYNEEAVTKKKYSEITSYEELNICIDEVLDEFDKDRDRRVAVGNVVSLVEQENATAIRINKSGTAIYYVDGIPEEKNYGDLYSISIVDNVVGTPERYDTDVYAGNCQFLSDSQFLYFKEFKDGSGELYLNKTRVDYDANPSVNYIETMDKLYYYTDWSDAREYGILKEYSNGESIKIADDIHSFMVTLDGRVLYLYDYSLRLCVGELHMWTNGESQKIDYDVVGLIPTIDYLQSLDGQVNNPLGAMAKPEAPAPAASSR